MRTESSRGFTLIEVLVVVTLLGLVVAVLSATIVVVLRANPANESRIDDAHVLQGLTTWLPQDIDSTPSSGFDVDPGRAADCAGSHVGTNLLHLTWSERVGTTTTTYVANYRHVPHGEGARIERITCHGTGSAPYGSVSTVRASGLVEALPAGWVPGTLPARVAIDVDGTTVVRVVFEVRSASGKLLQIEAAPKNPAAFLAGVTTTTITPPPSTSTSTTTTSTTTTTTTTVPPTSTSSTTSTTSTSSTTSTTTTTVPPTTTTIPCIVTAASPVIAETMGSVNDGHVGINTNGNTGQARLLEDVTVRINWSGGCEGIQLRYDPTTGGAPGAQSKLINFVVSGSSGTAVLTGPGSSDQWTGNQGGITHNLEVVSGGVVRLTITSLVVHVGNKVPGG